MRKLEKFILIILLLKTLNSVSYIQSQIKMLIVTTNRLIYDFSFDTFNTIRNFIMIVLPLILLIILIYGLGIMIKEKKIRFNKWIKIPVMYYLTFFLVFGISNFRQFLNSFDYQTTVQIIRIPLALMLNLLLLISYSIYSIKWLHKEIGDANIDVSSKVKIRLTNYIIDCIFIVLISMEIFISFDIKFDLIFILLPVYFGYYFFQETVFGQTIGKVFTNTFVLTIQKRNLKTWFIRTISRLIPFEPFSFFTGNKKRWHDKISKTIIIK